MTSRVGGGGGVGGAGSPAKIIAGRWEILAEGSRIDPGSEVWVRLRERLGSLLPGLVESAPPLFLLDRKLRLVPRGGEGEIYLEGAVAVEVDGPAAAAATLRPHPFAEEPGKRLVATGVRGRRRLDGRWELAAPREPAEDRAAAAEERGEKTADRVAAELAAADELRSEFTSREKNLSDARRALLARRLRGRSKKASPVEDR